MTPAQCRAAAEHRANRLVRRLPSQRRPRTATIDFTRAIALSLCALLAITLAACGPQQPDSAAAPAADARSAGLVLYCAAGSRVPMDRIIADYAKEAGVEISVSYAGSGTLLNQIEIAPGAADLYLAADASYAELAAEKGLTAERFDIARQHPVIAVAPGNPKNIRSIDDLLRDDVAIVLCDPEAASIGKVTRRLLAADGLAERLERRAVAIKPTVSEVLTDLRIGSADATIAWSATVAAFEGVEAVEVEPFTAAPETITLLILKDSEEPTEAIRFARFAAAADRGRAVFTSLGFESPGPADDWDPAPEVMLYAGTMFTAVIRDALRDFEQREGVTINTKYNGCGVLVSEMRAGAWPDAYLACDAIFMDEVDERFTSRTLFSENPIVIAVAAGNPKAIRSLQDLARPGAARVGLGHPTKSALGFLTQNLLDHAGLVDAIASSGNVVVDSHSGDDLINKLQLGAIDATICYTSNVRTVLDHESKLLMIPIEGIEGALAHQPYAVMRDTRHPQLMERLKLALMRADVVSRFTDAGFTWLAGDLSGTQPVSLPAGQPAEDRR